MSSVPNDVNFSTHKKIKFYNIWQFNLTTFVGYICKESLLQD